MSHKQSIQMQSMHALELEAAMVVVNLGVVVMLIILESETLEN